MTEKEVQDSLFRYFNARRGYTYQLCNAYVFKWESDFFCMASSGYSYEIEVKTSRQDFFADFKKEEKHSILSKRGSKAAIKVGSRYTSIQIIKNGQKCRNILYKPYINKRYYVLKRTNKYPTASNIKIKDTSSLSPNKFLYAVPSDLISPKEIPSYAGLIYIDEDLRKKPKIIKKPPAIHRKKNDYSDILLKKYYWAYLNSLNHKKEGKNFDFPNQ